MALKKTYQTKHNPKKITYWKINHYIVYPHIKKIEISLNGYESQEIAKNDDRYLASTIMSIAMPENAYTLSDLYQLVKKATKQETLTVFCKQNGYYYMLGNDPNIEPFFENAEDIIEK